MPAYQGRASDDSAAGKVSCMKPSPMQTRVTETAALLSYPQTEKMHAAVGNFVHQHSHQFEFCSEDSTGATLMYVSLFRLTLHGNCQAGKPDVRETTAPHFALLTCCAVF